MNAQPPPRPRSLLRSLVAAVGMLLMTCSGLCSAVVGINSLSEGGDLDGIATLLGAILVYGGVPFFLGWSLWRAGRSRG
ncbi:MAG: hypothetical protein K2Y51_19460 [Gammaproteobacteria bacterium]|nr:hypothetical protein [Gammaproteobacteria bacterium]